jgi:Zn-dependent protease with chaperone function
LEPTALPKWQHYAAHAAHESLERGRESGELMVTDRGFRFRGAKSEFFVPLAGAQLTLGGASDRLVFIAHTTEPGLSIYTSDHAILRDAVLVGHPELTLSLRGLRNQRKRGWSILLAACLVVVAAPIAFVMNIDYFAGIAAKQVPFMPADQVDPLLQSLTAPLITALGKSPYEFHFYIANDPTINAFALPGGYVVIHSELLLRAETADELLGVLAHEISHVTERHGTRSIIASAGAWLVFQAVIGDAGGMLTTLGSAAPFLLTQKYSRRFEFAADEQGYKLLEQAQIDAQGMVTFFKRIREEEAAMLKKAKEQLGEKSADVLTDLPEFLRTHPLTEKRIQHIEQLAAAQHGPYKNLNDTYTQLRAKVREFAARSTPKNTAETKSPAPPTPATETTP